MTNALTALQTDLNQQFFGRRHAIDGTLATIVAGEHVFLLGPPGTAKSAFVRAVAAAFGGAYFERLMTRATTPDELFGRPTLERMARGDYNAVTTGKVSECNFAFFDEVFKSNSMSLNALLGLLNERLYVTEDGRRITVPLVSAFGASNEMPDGKELEAFFDRFMTRFDVQYMSRRQDIRGLLLADEPRSTVRMTVGDLQAAQDAARKIPVADAAVESLMDLREALAAEGLQVSDRRLKKCLKLMRAVAYMDGQHEATTEDMLCLTDSLWREPKERGKVSRIVGKIADPVSLRVQEVVDAVRENVQQVSAKRGDRRAYVTAAAESLTQLDQQRVLLEDLAKQAGRRTRVVAQDGALEVAQIRADFTREISAGMMLGKKVGA